MALATISGVALAPGISRNRRLYTPELIAKAAKRMQERLADPNGLPIVMRTHHDAGDDSAKIVGRITAVSVDNNKSLRYKADLYDTFHAREIANLVTPEQPALRSVSIHGYWMGDTKQVQTEEGLATTADDLEIDAIDFTASPGVDGAVIDGSGKATESGGITRTPIREAHVANVTVSEEGSGWADVLTGAAPDLNTTRGRQVAEAKYSADDLKAMVAKGRAMKNADGEPSYPIADISDLKKAIRAVGRGKAGHDAIRAHIIKRAKALGASDLIPDNWGAGGKMNEHAVRLSDVKEYYPDGPDGVAGFCIDAYSGPLSVTIRGCVSPDELRGAAQAAAAAAMDAICTMDPDDDADIDAGSDAMEKSLPSGAVSPDDDMESTTRELVVKAEAPTLNTDELRALVQQYLDEHAAAYQKPTQEMTMSPDDHAHTHVTGDEDHIHAHKHDHPDESGGEGYSHSHTHGHVHASSDGESHEHGHNHIHTTSSSATAETSNTDNEEESVMGDTQKAAEAAPQATLTAEDMKFLGETIGNTMAEALRAFVEMSAPKHAAAAPQETTEQAEEAVAESTPAGVPAKATDLAALKESLAKELRTELRNELRSEFLKENGLPPRRGYRLTENDEPEEMTDSELFAKHRTSILLGDYGLNVPAPDAATKAA